VHLIEDDLVRMIDPPEARYEGQHGKDGDGKLVVPLVAMAGLEFALDFGDGIVDLVHDSIRVGCGWSFLVLCAAMPHASWGGHGGL
jgi:hypothetical protein